MLDTLEQARKEVFDNLAEGTICPCCDQLAKKYQRILLGSMVRSLIDLYHQQTNVYPIHVTKIKGASAGGGSFALLRHWGLIKEAEKTDTVTRTSGFWFITYKGRDFLKANIQVPKYLDTYNGKILGFSDEMISVKDALGNKFDYAELMGFELPPPPEVKRIINEPIQESLL